MLHLAEDPQKNAKISVGCVQPSKSQAILKPQTLDWCLVWLSQIGLNIREELRKKAWLSRASREGEVPDTCVISCSFSHLAPPGPPVRFSMAEPQSVQVRPGQLMRAAAVITWPDWMSAGELGSRRWPRLPNLVANNAKMKPQWTHTEVLKGLRHMSCQSQAAGCTLRGGFNWPFPPIYFIIMWNQANKRNTLRINICWLKLQVDLLFVQPAAKCMKPKDNNSPSRQSCC